MTPHRVGITRFDDSNVAATVFTLPGCHTTAADEAALGTTLPLAIAEFQVWLARHGEANADIGYEVVERIDITATDAADGEFTFAWDREPASEGEVATALRWMAYAREDLLGVTSPLSDAILDWRPPDSAMAHTDPWKPHALTIREIIADIASAEGYYRSGISDDAEAPDTAQTTDLTRERERTLAHFRALTDEQLATLCRVRRPWQPEGAAEEWTVRKALRRIISHERFHTKEIEQRLSWLVLGVPEIHR